MCVQAERLRAVLCSAAAALLLVGCGGTVVTQVGGSSPVPPPSTGYAGVAFTGKVMGGSTPVAGASVELLSAATTGNGAGGTALLTTPATTDGGGNFTIPAGYTCASPATQLYLVARGGGLVPGQSANAAISLLLALGPCSSLGTGAGTGVTVNEVTTVAGVWAMSPFLGPAGALGSTATNTIGLANAARTAAALVNASQQTGGAGAASIATYPIAKLNSLADLLHQCVAGAPGCGSLLSLAASSGTAPVDTLEAARQIALHAGANVPALFALQTADTAFQPALTAAPADWTLPVVYRGGGMNAPSALGVDSGGTVWVASYFGALSAFSPVGVPLFAGGISGSGLNHSYGLAIDAADAVWVTNEDSAGATNGGLGTVSKFSNAGQPLSGANGFTAGGLNFPVGLAIDANGSVWVVNYGDSHVTLLDLAGDPLSGATGYAVRGGAFPVVVALDAAHNGWIGDQNDAVVTRLSADGQQAANFSCCNAPAGVATDQAGGVWLANYAGDSVSRIAGTHTAVFTGGGLNHPQGIAVDGAGRAWVASFAAAAVTELAGASDAQPGAVLSPAAGWGADGPVSGAFALAIDASGDVWVTGFNNDTLTEYLGIATPVRTPLLGPAQAP